MRKMKKMRKKQKKQNFYADGETLKILKTVEKNKIPKYGFIRMAIKEMKRSGALDELIRKFGKRGVEGK